MHKDQIYKYLHVLSSKLFLDHIDKTHFTIVEFKEMENLISR